MLRSYLTQLHNLKANAHKTDKSDDVSVAGQQITLEQLNEKDEYTLSSREPTLLLTTSRSPSKYAQVLVKELCLVLPNSTRINRGSMNNAALLELCQSSGVTDLIEVGGSNKSGKPTQLKLTHFPNGPTLYFKISSCIMRSELSERPVKLKEGCPHLIFHGFEGTEEAKKIKRALVHLFPIMVNKSNRYLTFVAFPDAIRIRNFYRLGQVYDDENLMDVDDKVSTKMNIIELGPRIDLDLYKWTSGSVAEDTADTVWEAKHFTRKTRSLFQSF